MGILLSLYHLLALPLRLIPSLIPYALIFTGSAADSVVYLTTDCDHEIGRAHV